jgi:nitrite reductase/ring-hydroxylating ferredoxin subunit
MLARFDDLPDPGAIALTFRGEGAYFSLILARRGDAVFAYENNCPHAGYPLQRADGRVLLQDARYLVCNAHGASFLLDTGACAGGPCNGEGLKPFAVELRDGVVLTPSRRDRDSDRGAGA